MEGESEYCKCMTLTFDTSSYFGASTKSDAEASGVKPYEY